MTRNSRETDIRTHQLRDNYSSDYISPLHVPEEVRRPGYDYYYVRTDVKGTNDHRLEEMINFKGWSPVPAERLKSYKSDPLGRNKLTKDFICFKDVMLLERESIYTQRDLQRQDDLNTQKLKSLQGVTRDVPMQTNAVKPHNPIGSF